MERKRDISLKTGLKMMEKLMKINDHIQYEKKVNDRKEIYKCKSPSGVLKKLSAFGATTIAGDDDKKAMAITLTKIFNSPILMTADLDDEFRFDGRKAHLDDNYLIKRDLCDTFRINDQNKRALKNLANELLTKLKCGTCPELPMGLKWTEYRILTGITFEESKDYEQKDFLCGQCRLNNPNSYWAPKNLGGHQPYLQINFSDCNTYITKLRIQGSIGRFTVKAWDLDRDEYGWQQKGDYEVKNASKHDSQDVVFHPAIRTKHMKIVVPSDDSSAVNMRLEIFGTPLKWNHKRLLLLKDITFQELVVATKIAGNQGAANFKEHWALKFEGKTHLLTIEWFNNSKVLCTLEENTPIGQRRHWYWASNDPADETEWFTQRWGSEFRRLIINTEVNEVEISAECIGKLIDKWIKTYKTYNNISNNCQHFVRDILSIFSKNAAKSVVVEMGHVHLNNGIHSLIQMSDQRSEHNRLNEVRNILSAIFVEHQKEILSRKQKMNQLKEHKIDALQDTISELKSQNDKLKEKIAAKNKSNKLKWDKHEVANWVGNLGQNYKKYMKMFIQDDIHGELLDTIKDPNDLDVIDKRLHRKKILFEWGKI